jgi:hypothetical protein
MRLCIASGDSAASVEAVARVLETHLEELPADVNNLRKLARTAKKVLTKKEQQQWDETAQALGSSLRLPAKLEAHRAEIEAALPPLT